MGKNPYTKKELYELLGLKDDIEKLSLAFLATKAFEGGLVSEEDFLKLTSTNVTTIKRYLFSVLNGVHWRNAIDNYVKTSSKMFTAGSITLNAFLAYCIKTMEIDTIDSDFLSSVLDQTFLKYVLLPFKSEVAGSKAKYTKNNILCSVWEKFLQENFDQLQNFYPSPEECKNTIHSWDQPLNNMSGRLGTNLKTHIFYHFPTRFQKYLFSKMIEEHGLEHRDIEIENEGKRKVLARVCDENEYILVSDLYDLINTGKSLQNDRFLELENQVLKERHEIGLEPKIHLNTMGTFQKKLLGIVFKKHIDICKYVEQLEETNYTMMKHFSIAPVNKIRRVYCYIDKLVLENIAKKYPNIKNTPHQSNLSLREVFSLDSKLWKLKGREIKEQIKKKRKHKKRAYLRKRRGVGRLPEGAHVHSIQTDGVGIAINMYTLPKKVKEAYTIPTDQLKENNYHIIAFDEGRVNLFQSAQKDCTGTEFVTTRITAKKYQEKSKIIKHREWDLQQRERYPVLSRAYEEMSHCTWKTANFDKFMQMTQVCSKHLTSLQTHFVDNVEYAKWRMLLWRKKMSVMSRAYSATIKKNNEIVKNPGKCVLVMSIGNAKIQPTGKKGREKERHGGVPTSWKAKILRRVLQGIKGLRFVMMEVDEFRTTKCCHKCQHVLNDMYDKERNVLRGLKHCLECSKRENVYKTRNRDFNAAKNIWEITKNELENSERPTYLQRPKRTTKDVFRSVEPA